MQRPATAGPAASPEGRLRIYFFVQFLSVGLVNAYSGIWFAHLGLDAVQIGLLGAAPIALLLFVTLFVGRLADRARDWGQVIRLGGLVSAVFAAGLFGAEGFVAILILWALTAGAQRVVVPVTDAAALRMLRRRGAEFGPFRALSTIGYLLAVGGVGLLMGQDRIDLFLPLFVGFCVLRAIAAFGLPPMRDPGQVRTARTIWQGFPQMRKAWFVLPLLAWAFIDSNHMILNSFQGLLWAEQGITTATIGFLIVLGALAETAMFFGFRRIATRWPPLTLMMIAAVASVVRWTAMSMAPGVPVLIVLQLLHALTYAMGFLAITNFIADKTDESDAAEAQSFLVVIELALASGIVVIFGMIAQWAGAGAYLFSAAIAMGGAISIMAAMRRIPD
ncbi:MFS transporter [Ponticoccus sp. SC2-23]|uniref:MFS transporter n=1 Tax=Alexandriicola marinus TaxID=2081710 RepID=UPI000FDBA165|nr:MFS transporter [Alexandriicola marinus]MBM1220046.1 MFS transporter [Ponticoccus sp. SC6-9]MBM1224732.1 MFS transporter [Ponticoccus sp. SC6-15]MBM1228245.1 MFS transporter [Ponticoccus sp. SC6-38]MBM1234117.1 MFS transporter [Ponticoccus sp. SC6-45]MBM1238747.1 MFS transporter [Ponticoccus sp. SC6-49]MBM1242528.1 MFS transporter [Ponticoccus sp. SC2-64]MBM1247641.1 MFS transporter [Ponticoccus sp. SC6-42]MBM1251700.1 MFS transporter [Ponticoccus sp. SC6-33]MBM1256756.1 MFS transporter